MISLDYCALAGYSDNSKTESTESLKPFEAEIINKIQKLNLTKKTHNTVNSKDIDDIYRKIMGVVRCHFFDKLSLKFINTVNKDFLAKFAEKFDSELCSIERIRDLWDQFSKVNTYIHTPSDITNKTACEKEITVMINLLKNREDCTERCFPKSDWTKEDLVKAIKSKLTDIIKHSSKKISPDLIDDLDRIVFEKYPSHGQKKLIWKLFCQINAYIYADTQSKPKLLNELEDQFKYPDPTVVARDITKVIYLSDVPELIALHKKCYPKPSVSIFDDHHIPQCLAKEYQEYEEKNRRVANFKQLHAHDVNLEKKIMFIQRHMRAKIRQQSEVQRIIALYFSDMPPEKAAEKTYQVMKDANTPYRPQKCSAELAERIIKASEQVILHSTVSHLTATKNIATIIDGCLFGRETLVATKTDFRPAALGDSDIKNGDGNVICFGPQEIDDLCLKNRTVKLEFDLPKLLDTQGFNRNPNIFFKQMDFGYKPWFQKVTLNENESLKLKTNAITLRKISETSLKLKTKSETFYSTLPNYSFISYNLKEMHKIWALNFFRFLDTLKTAQDGTNIEAPDEIQRIYEQISKLNDNQLVEFITSLGKSMSNTAEFNFYGAYKIDLDALVNIGFYKEKDEQDVINIKQLISELNAGNFASLTKIKKYAPELLKSTRFVEFLASKITHPSHLVQFKKFFDQI